MSTIKSSAEHLTLNADGASKDIKFQANGVEKASIDSSGNLTVSGNLTSVGIDDNADATAITIDANENVGIGDASPDRKLHVNSGATNVVAKFESTDSISVAEFTDSTGSAEIGCSGNDVVFFPAGAERMRIDSSGRVTMPNQPAFHAKGSSFYVARPSPINYNTAIFNTGGHYSTSTYKFTAPVAGSYLFTVGAIADGSSGAGGPQLVKNGTSFAKSFAMADERCRVCSAVIDLAVNDWVAVYVEGETTYYLGDGYGHFSGHLIG